MLVQTSISAMIITYRTLVGQATFIWSPSTSKFSSRKKLNIDVWFGCTFITRSVKGTRRCFLSRALQWMQPRVDDLLAASRHGLADVDGSCFICVSLINKSLSLYLFPHFTLGYTLTFNFSGSRTRLLAVSVNTSVGHSDKLIASTHSG